MAHKNLKVHLVIVDPQNDFMGNNDGTPLSEVTKDGVTHTAALPVKGALADMRRAAAMIDRIGPKLEDIHVTLDSHHVVDVAHPGMWRDVDGKPPSPFTIIGADDIRNGIWLPKNPAFTKRLLGYTEELARKGKYLLIVWPEHCLIGSWGHAVEGTLYDALNRWARREVANIDWVVKGTNPFTEHYGGLMAEVPDPNDPSTQLNAGLIRTIQEADIVGVLGEASSHCVKETFTQLVENIGVEHVKKLTLITDCMSPVPQAPGTPDFPAIAEQFLRDMKARGVTLTTSKEFLA